MSGNLNCHENREMETKSSKRKASKTLKISGSKALSRVLLSDWRHQSFIKETVLYESPLFSSSLIILNY